MKLKIFMSLGKFCDWETGAHIPEPKGRVQVLCTCLAWFETWADDNGERCWKYIGPLAQPFQNNPE